MPSVIANDIRIEYERFGSPSDPAIVMIMGLASQLTMWPQEMIDAFVGAGYQVIRFDNRDVGLSQKLHGRHPPNILAEIVRARIGLTPRAPYTLHDMVEDTAGLLRALDIPRAHIIGASLGGMVAQIFAATHPDMTLSLTSIMSSTGNPRLKGPSRQIIKSIIMRKTPKGGLDEMVEESLERWDMIGSQISAEFRAKRREMIRSNIQRSHYPLGAQRQLAAVIATGDFREFCRKIITPTLIIHGANDPLVPVEGSLDSARCIRRSSLNIIDGMGHDFPPQFIDKINEAILTHLRVATGVREPLLTTA